MYQIDEGREFVSGLTLPTFVVVCENPFEKAPEIEFKPT
jgi:hypothetical protein